MATPVRRRADDTPTAPTADRYRSRRVADDDEDDERPARSRRTDDDDDDDGDDDEVGRARRRRDREDDPAPRRRRPADDMPTEERNDRLEDDDDDEDEPRGRRKRTMLDEDDEDKDEDERPRSRRSRARDDDDDDDDEDDSPLKGRADKPKSSAGWDKFKKKRQEMGNFANELRIPEGGDQVLVKFIDDEPFATYGLHWIRTDRGQRSYICLEAGCPLCDRAGDSPRAMAAFNVLVLDEDADPKPMVWAVGSGVGQMLETKASAKTGPLSREYYAVSKTKSGRSSKGPVQYQIDVVKARDLREDWGLKPLADAVLDQYASKAWDEERFLKRPTRAELKAIAREAMDDDD